MTPNDILNFLLYEVVIAPIHWTGSDLPIGDTPIPMLLKVIFVFLLLSVATFWLVHTLLLKPFDKLWHKLRGKEYTEEFGGWAETTAIWVSIVIVLVIWSIASELLNN